MSFNIKSFLDKYKNLKDPREEKEKIAKILAGILKIEIPAENISIKKGILSIKADNYLKTEIFLKKEKLLEEFKKKDVKVFEIK
jgi:hypothetical protein